MSGKRKRGSARTVGTVSQSASSTHQATSQSSNPGPVTPTPAQTGRGGGSEASQTIVGKSVQEPDHILRTCSMCDKTMPVDDGSDAGADYFVVECDECGALVCGDCYSKCEECGSCEKYGSGHVCGKCCKGITCPGAGWLVCNGCARNCAEGDCYNCQRAEKRRQIEKQHAASRTAYKSAAAQQAAKNLTARTTTVNAALVSNESKQADEDPDHVLRTCGKCNKTLPVNDGSDADAYYSVVECDECGALVCGACYSKWEECGSCEKYGGGQHVCGNCCGGVRCAGAGWLVCSGCAQNCLDGCCGRCGPGGVAYADPEDDDCYDLYY